MILSLLIFSPLVIAGLLVLAPQNMVRKFSFLSSLLLFAGSLVILKKFDPSTSGLQMVENYVWVKDFGISYFLGIDGISLWLVLLSTFLLPILILGSWNSIEEKVKGFHINLFILTSAMIGTFVAMDGILFYIFFEASLIPMYFIVGIWGGQRRLYATMKFFIYTMAGSVLMLVAIIG
ncbi:MAG: Fe-S-binding domain-containing protein, partial [Bdellovibrionales bacterium]|nr:Fe-S-binding domain-containing protein [Bdellovibrionales bacterium]